MGLFSSKKNEQQDEPPAPPAQESAPQAASAPRPVPVKAAPAEEYAVMPREWRVAIAGLQGHALVEDDEVVKVPMAEVFPISAAIAKEERRKEAARKKAEEEALKNPQIGQEIIIQGVSQGIFFGQVQILGQIFNACAAPEDLPGTRKYVETVEYIAGLKNWHGHDGTRYATDKEIRKALQDGSYIKEGSGWIIPPRELLTGTEANGPSGVRKGTIVQADNLFDHRNDGSFKSTFKTAAASGSDFPHWYWSSTENRDGPSGVWLAGFSDGDEGWGRKDDNRLSCRPVRLLPVVAP